MIYALNGIAFAWIASFWSKTGGLNIVVATFFTIMAILNCALAAPFVYRWLGLA